MAATDLDKKLQLNQLIATGEAKRIRETARITLEDIASDINVHYMTVWRWENRYRIPRGNHALRYLGALNRIAATLNRDPTPASVK